jgi:DNA-binding transcriptional ArsR family regulator
MLNHQPDLNLVFHALSDPHRRGMVERLSQGPMSVTALAQPLPLSLPAVMQHLQVLQAAGLVSSEKVGRVRTCSVRPDILASVENWINGCRAEWVSRLDRLGVYLDHLASDGVDRGTDTPSHPDAKFRPSPGNRL